MRDIYDVMNLAYWSAVVICVLVAVGVIVLIAKRFF
jgi:hypothetical protein